MAEYEVVNYSNEDSFESFCRKNKGKILKNLKGKKMKKRHLRNARKLLDESTELPTPEKNEILIDAIGETVNESESEGFEGEEFDHFRFAQKLRQKVEQKLNKPLPKLSIKNIFQKKQVLQTLAPQPPPKNDPAVIAQNGQLTSPANPTKPIHPYLDLTKPIDKPGYSPTGQEAINTVEDKKAAKPNLALRNAATEPLKEPVPPAEEKKAIQEAKAETVASNGQLAFPAESAGSQGTSGGSETPAASEEQVTQTGTSTASSQGAATTGTETTKTTETKPEEKKGINKKWLWGGGVLLVVIIIILIVALKK